MDSLYQKTVEGLSAGGSLNILFILLFLFLLRSSFVTAQTSSLKVGDQVRVTAPFVDPLDRIKGTVSEMSGSVLVLSKRDSLIYISDSLIQSLEISTRKKRVIGRGLLIGAVTTTVLFGAIAAIRNDQCSINERDCTLNTSNGDAFVSGGTVGLLSGAVAGAITGFFIKIDDWERAPVRFAIGVSSIPSNLNESSLEPNISFKIGFGE